MKKVFLLPPSSTFQKMMSPHDGILISRSQKGGDFYSFNAVDQSALDELDWFDVFKWCQGADPSTLKASKRFRLGRSSVFEM